MPEKKGEYPTGEARTKGPKGTKDAKEAIKETKPMSLLEEDMLLDLTYDELKQAFRCRKKNIYETLFTIFDLFRLFDSEGEGFIPVMRFREILQEVDEDFTEVELDDIIAEVGSGPKTKIPTYQ